jgi:hypothetical protein
LIDEVEHFLLIDDNIVSEWYRPAFVEKFFEAVDQV